MASEHVVELSDATFQTEVLQSAQLVLVDFWAPWCGPCRQLAPTIESLAKKYQGQIKVGKMNVVENQQAASAYRIEGIPTVMLFHNGEAVQSLVGVQSMEQYEQAVAPWTKAE